jgi:hypothetical protein
MDARSAKSILILEDEPLIALDHDLHVGELALRRSQYFPRVLGPRMAPIN